MKIALISHLFPTELQPFSGKFIKDQLRLLDSYPDTSVDLVVPTPFSIPFTHRHKRSNSPLLTGSNRDRIKYLSIPRRKFPRIIQHTISNTVYNYFKDLEYNLVHVHWLYPDALCIPALKSIGFKVVLTIHGSDWYQTKNNSTLLKQFKALLNQVDRILYSGPMLKKDIELILPELSSKSDIIYNLVDEHIYTVPTEKVKLERIKQLNWNPSKKNVLIVSNIRVEKGIDILLEAVSNNKNLSDTHFHIVGSTRNDSYSKEIKYHINQLDNVDHYFPVPPNDLIGFFQASDLFVLPSRREGFNVSILEAMACGLPVVCTDTGGNKEIVSQKTGLITKNINSRDIGSSVSKMLLDLPKYNSSEISQLVKKKFGKIAFRSRLISNYQKVLS